MYVIHNRKIWKSYQGGGAWYTYTGTSDPHTNHVHISLSNAGGNGTTSFWSGSFGGPQPLAPSAGALQADFTGDGNADIAAFYNYDGAWTRLFLWPGNGKGGFAAPVQMWDSGIGNWDWNRMKPVVGDFNGDKRTDIAAFYNYDGAWTRLWLLTMNGSAVNTEILWDSGANNFDWNRTIPLSGDFNGDGKSDVGAMYNYDGALSRLFVWTGDGAAHLNAPAQWWDSGKGNWDTQRTRAFVADYNRDGKSDVAAFYNYDNAQTKLWVFSSSGTAFNNTQMLWDSGANNFEWNRLLVA